MKWFIPWVIVPVLLAAAAGRPDLSSPKAAARSLYVAIEAGNVKDLRHILLAEEESQHPYLDAVAEMIIAAKKLGNAASLKFGASGESFARGMIDRQDIAKVEQAEVKIVGDVATVTVPDQTFAMQFKQVNKGIWRLMVIDEASAKSLPRQEAMSRSLTKLFNDMAAEIAAGKFTTAGDAEQAMSQRMHSLMIRMAKPSTTRPT